MNATELQTAAAQADADYQGTVAQARKAAPAAHLLTGVDTIELDRALVARGGLSMFVQLAWRHVEPAPLKWGWHMGLVCDHLAAVSRGECLELVINIPPGMSKSLLTCVFWPAWDWGPGGHPGRKWMFTSFDGQLSLRDAARCKELVQSRWYQERWGWEADPKARERWSLKPVGIVGSNTDKKSGRRSARADSASEYYTTSLGMRFSTFFGGKATGWHADIQVCDDPTKPRDVQDGGPKAAKVLQRTNATWKGTYSSRTTDKEKFARVVIMQRLHATDLATACIKDGYTALVLPQEFVPSRRCVTQWGSDPRTQEGELLCPSRFSAAAVAKIRAKDMSPRDYAAQHQQSPSPEGGAIFQRGWYVRRWRSVPVNARWLVSVDCAFKDEQGSDWCVMQVWAKHGGDYYLCDQRRGKWDVLRVCEEIEKLKGLWPRARQVIVEDKANGVAVVQIMRTKVPGFLLVTPKGGKVARANAVEFAHRAGNVLLPEDGFSQEGEDNSVELWVQEHVDFPRAANDDQVDAGTQALLWFEGVSGGSDRLQNAMDNVTL